MDLQSIGIRIDKRKNSKTIEKTVGSLEKRLEYLQK